MFFRVCYKTTVAGKVDISIYNLTGQRILTLVSAIQQADDHSVVWGGTSSTGKLVNSGIYFCTFSIDEKPLVIRKLVLLQ